MRLMITVQATENVDDLVNGGGVVVIIKDIPFKGLVGGQRAELNNEDLADFIAMEAGHARRRFMGEFAPAVAIQIIQ